MKLLIVFLLCGASEAFLAPSGRPRLTASITKPTRGGIVTLTCHRPEEDGTPDCDEFTWTKRNQNLPNLPNTQIYQFTMDSLHEGLFTCQCSNTWGSSDSSLPVYIRLLETSTTTTAPSRCAEPGSILHGRIIQLTATTATYTCNTGYNIQRSGVIICLSNGQWQPLPICVPDGPKGQATIVTTTTSLSTTGYVNLTCVLPNEDCTSFSWKKMEGTIRHLVPTYRKVREFMLVTDPGHYVCRCENQYGESEWSKTVQVFSGGEQPSPITAQVLKPTIVASINEQYNGDDVTLTCTLPDDNNNNKNNAATCSTYRWTRLEGNLNYLPNTATYKFTMDTRHQGNYTCQCDDQDATSVTSDPVNVSSLGAKTAEVSEPEHGSSNGGLVAGLVVCVLVTVVIVIVAMVVFKKYEFTPKRAKEETATSGISALRGHKNEAVNFQQNHNNNNNNHQSSEDDKYVQPKRQAVSVVSDYQELNEAVIDRGLDEEFVPCPADRKSDVSYENVM